MSLCVSNMAALWICANPEIKVSVSRLFVIGFLGHAWVRCAFHSLVMGGSESKNDDQLSEIHFSEEEKKYISRLFVKLSHDKKHLTKNQLEVPLPITVFAQIKAHTFGGVGWGGGLKGEYYY